ncbi:MULTISPECIES: 3-isopropylmalate dehydratase small subunit [Geobacillus]|jgi:3-isopropylmalate/(R)-2-methylmalate dehydratase small subunit|uniref:3-isopropylmalate dehydratase small subunit n=1 Tax=Geobacillus thermocatenulatus TaxID=33938 RepID=A0A226QBP2_9BACL|nr:MULTISPECIES: 3-isopropylmalate dehydratase small subunit [Geobacillus]KPC97225.1 3-isopropylmalate dehydratase small subunit [Geobacillus sp. BCO2]AST00365.1 3-isopropylmalate dehydratase small subunit [Geobacillus thermocatenulatus]KLR72110.1 isopropylmalate isomerase [Geobacillus sp. T6]KYD30733.1 3-isopropylmalate dehydratase small subunit [Geobacillus sp. B4113_201601]OXB89911.1 3-isopropylmalate dehydratase small subunit [Geobacillus thermocatenulatus]
MKAIRKVSGKALPLGYSDVDTDQIAPSDTMKFSERVNLSDYLFRDWREDPNFVLNKPEHRGSIIILAGENFGCGSSREHAPWALLDYGFRAVIAPSFGDIFKNNCSKVGLLAIELPDEIVKILIQEVEKNPEAEITIDLEKCVVIGPNVIKNFMIDEFTRQKLLKGLDDIELTLLYEKDIKEYEQLRPSYYPSINS